MIFLLFSFNLNSHLDITLGRDDLWHHVEKKVFHVEISEAFCHANLMADWIYFLFFLNIHTDIQYRNTEINSHLSEIRETRKQLYRNAIKKLLYEDENYEEKQVFLDEHLVDDIKDIKLMTIVKRRNISRKQTSKL